MTTKARVFLTFLTMLVFGVCNFLLNTAAPIIAGNLAGNQLDDSNFSYGVSQTMRYFTGSGLSILVLLIIVGLIWVKPVRAFFATLLALVGLATAIPPSAHAYYSKSNYTEAVMIKPNESAFWIPDVGANKEAQVKFDSEAYYNENKIAAKRFIIPHTQLSGSGWGTDYYVPAGRLILVDRTPFNREWTAASSRGTSDQDQSFPCQSNEGLNITAEVAVAASVSEDNAAKFLYNFGVLDPKCDGESSGDPSDTSSTDAQACIFTSVYHGRSLTRVMDSVGRGLVQTAVCDALSADSLANDNKNAGTIMTKVGAAASKFLADRGITLDYIGWAGTFTFDHDVQDAINKQFIAQAVASGMPVLTNLANIEVREGMGKGIADHGLPSTLLIPSGFDFTSMFATGQLATKNMK